MRLRVALGKVWKVWLFCLCKSNLKFSIKLFLLGKYKWLRQSLVQFWSFVFIFISFFKIQRASLLMNVVILVLDVNAFISSIYLSKALFTLTSKILLKRVIQIRNLTSFKIHFSFWGLITRVSIFLSILTLSQYLFFSPLPLSLSLSLSFFLTYPQLLHLNT